MNRESAQKADVPDRNSAQSIHIDIESLYVRSYPTVRAYVLQNSGTEEDAKDVFQEAMLNAWLNVKRGRFEARTEDAMGAYIYTIAKHKWLDKIRSKAHRSTLRLVDSDIGDANAESNTDQPDFDIDYLDKLYGRLDDKCQVLLKKFYFAKMSLRDIAADLGHDEGSIRTMKYRCVMKLRQMHIASQAKDDK